jgi:hypothetical protein
VKEAEAEERLVKVPASDLMSDCMQILASLLAALQVKHMWRARPLDDNKMCEAYIDYPVKVLNIV